MSIQLIVQLTCVTKQNRAYHRGQYQVVRPNQGGGSNTVKITERPKCKQIVSWKSENLTTSTLQNPMHNAENKLTQGGLLL